MNRLLSTEMVDDSFGQMYTTDMEAQSTLTTPAPVITDRIRELARAPKKRGAYFQDDAKTKDCALVTAKSKDTNFYWLVEPDSHRVLAAKFFSYGGQISVAAGEWICNEVEGKSFYNSLSMTMAEVERALRDKPEEQAISSPIEKYLGHLPDLFNTLAHNYESARNVALAAREVVKNADTFRPSVTESEKVWKSKPKEEQLQIIEKTLNEKIRMGLNMDGGDVLVMDIEDGERLKVQYQGACGGCSSSTGATLSFIENALRQETYDGLQVIPS